MSRRRSGRTAPASVAAEIGPDDGADPKAFHDRRMAHRERGRGPGRKGLQLCGQVRDALHGILAGCADEVLQQLAVVSVEPAPNTGRLLVTVSANGVEPSVASERLSRANGMLRSEVAAVISRRYAPELAFRVA